MFLESERCVAESAYYHRMYASVLSDINLRLAHNPPRVWCIKGPKGVGKAWLASWMANAMQRVARGPLSQQLMDVHRTPSDDVSPLILAAETEGGQRPEDVVLRETPTIDHVRDLLQRLSMTSSPLEYRTVTIGDMHLWNASCMNAMLKVLETPPPRTVFIITTSANLPATIQSRCHTIVMHPEVDPWQPLASPTEVLSAPQVVTWLSQGCFQRQQYWADHASWALDGWRLLEDCKTSTLVVPSAAWFKELADEGHAWSELLYVWGHRQYRWALASQAFLHWDAFWSSLWAVTSQGQQLFVDSTTLVCHCLARVQQFFAYYHRHAALAHAVAQT